MGSQGVGLSDFTSLKVAQLLCGRAKAKARDYLLPGLSGKHRFVTSAAAAAKLCQLCPTLWDPRTAAYQAPPSMGLSRQEYWNGLPFPFPGDLPESGTEPRSPTLQADALPTEPPRKSFYRIKYFTI